MPRSSLVGGLTVDDLEDEENFKVFLPFTAGRYFGGMNMAILNVTCVFE